MCNYYLILLNVNGAGASCQFQLVTSWKTTTDGTESDMRHTLFCHDREKTKRVCHSELSLDESARCAPPWPWFCFLLPSVPSSRWGGKVFTSSWKLVVSAVFTKQRSSYCSQDVEATEPISAGHILSSSGALRTFSFSLLSVSIETVLHLISIQSSFCPRTL